MTQDNSPSNQPTDPIPPRGEGDVPPEPVKKKRKKRWLILKIGGVLVALLILLIFFAPTIASMGLVRESIVDRVNTSTINGHLVIDNWSFGWISGVHVEGIHLMDLNNSHVAEIKDLTAGLSLLKATMGNIVLGDVHISGVDFNLRRDKDGQLNIGQLFKSSTTTSDQQSKLPNVSGNIQLSNVTGTFQDDKSGETMNLQSVDGTVTIKNINEPIVDSLDIKGGILNKPAGEIKIDGTISAVKNNQVDVDHTVATQTVQITNIDSAAANGFLRDQKIDVKVGGLISCNVKVDVNTINTVSANGSISIDQLAVNQVRYKHIAIPITASYSGTAMKAEIPLTADSDQINVHVNLPSGSLEEVANLFKSVAAKFLKQESTTATSTVASAGTGDASITADIHIAPILTVFGDLIHLGKAVNITGGRFIYNTKLTLQNQTAVIAIDSHLKDIAGTKDGNPITLQNFDASVGISAGGSGDLKDFKLDVKSGFLTIAGAGETLSKIAINGSGSLQELQKETAPFVDWAGRQIAGKLDLHAQTNGDLTSADGALNVDAHGGFSDFGITGGPGAAVQVKSIQLTAQGRRDANGFGPVKPVALNFTDIAVETKDEMGMPQTAREPIVSITLDGHGNVKGNVTDLKGIVLTMTAGPESSRWLDLRFSADANVTAQVTADGTESKTSRVPRMQLERCDVDAARFQAQFGPILASFKPDAKPEAIPAAEVVMPVPAAASTNSILDLLAHNILVISTGKAAATFSGSYDGTTLKIDKPLTVLITDLALQQPGGSNDGNILREPFVRAIVGGTIGTENQMPTSAKGFSVALQVGADSAPTVAVNFDADLLIKSIETHDANGKPITQNVIYAPRFQLSKCTVDFPKAQNEFAPLVNLLMASPPPTAPSAMDRILNKQVIASSGALNATASGSYTSGGFVLDNTTAVNIDHLTLNDLAAKGKQAIVDQSIHVTAGASANADLTAIQNASINIDSEFAKVALTNASISLGTMQGEKRIAAGTLEMLQSAHLKIDKGDVAKMYAMLAVLQPPEAPVVPLEVLGGVLTLDADVARQGQTMSANVTSLDIAGLGVRRGKAVYTWPADITAKLNAQVDTRNNATGQAAILDQLGRLSITALAADFGIAKVSLVDQKPINISDFGDPQKMAAQGGVALTGDVPSVCRLMEVISGAPANSYPYTGTFQLSESLAKDAGRARITIAGGGAVNNFQVLNNPGTPTQAVAFSEPRIDISNPMIVNMQSDTIAIDAAKPITIAMTSSGALTIKITGDLQKWETARILNNVKVSTNYDLEKLWKIVYPMLSPDMQAKLKDATVTGIFQKDFVVKGSYPAGKPFNEAIKTIDASGSIAVATASGSGLSITSIFEVPVTLRAGIARLVDLNGHSMKPAACNGGTIELGSIAFDLTGPTMIANIENVTAQKPLIMLKSVSINPTFAKTFLAQIMNNPAFANADQAKGEIDFSISQLKNLPLSALATQDVPANISVADAKYSITGLAVGSTMIGSIAQLAGGRADNFTNMEIRDATVHFEHGKVVEDSTLMISAKYPLRIYGTVGLEKSDFEPMIVRVPIGLLEHVIPNNTMKYMPDAVELPLKGSMANPQLQVGNVISKLIQDATQKAIVNGLLGGKSNNTGGGGATSQPSQSDPLDDLLKGLNKPKNGN